MLASHLRLVPLAAAALVLSLSGIAAAERKTYVDTKGVSVELPLGDVSFADRVVSFAVGSPASKMPGVNDPARALGPADYVPDSEGTYLTLGCGGTLILEFTDNALVNGPGVDLHIFEIGPDVEDQHIAVSSDGRNWVELGQISGGTASVDIGASTTSRDTFNYVRLTDARESCGSRWPGADIDAVAAVGGALRVTLSSTVLFDFDRAELKPAASQDLDAVVGTIGEYPGGRVVVEGHTDAVGAHAYNEDLSLRRALAVVTYLKARGVKSSLEGRGHGETRPTASNTTEEGRQANRRVEILIIPEAR